MAISTDDSTTSDQVHFHRAMFNAIARMTISVCQARNQAGRAMPRFKGQLKPTGVRPKFSQKLADHGIRLGPEMFSATQADGGHEERGRR